MRQIFTYVIMERGPPTKKPLDIVDSITFIVEHSGNDDISEEIDVGLKKMLREMNPRLAVATESEYNVMERAQAEYEANVRESCESDK